MANMMSTENLTFEAEHERDETCNLMFCIAAPHDDDLHVDQTGYSWRAPNVEHKVIAHVYLDSYYPDDNYHDPDMDFGGHDYY